VVQHFLVDNARAQFDTAGIEAGKENNLPPQPK
jgi:hypothetical protein